MIRSPLAIALAIAGATTVSSTVARAQEPAPKPETASPQPPSAAPPPEAAPPAPGSPATTGPTPPGDVAQPASAQPGAAVQSTGNAGAAQTTPPEAAKPALPEWLQGVTLGAGVLLWYYQPIHVPNTENSASVFWARLLLDGKWGAFGVHIEPRLRDSKLRPFYDGPAWLEEAYGSVDLGPVQLRVGKTYSRFGLFWYTSFYGNVQVYDGMKLDPDYGATLQGDVGKPDDTFSLGWWAQYFLIDGGTNVSLQNRDTISYPGAHRRNQAIARIEPRLHVGSTTIALGASGEYLQADLPSIGPQNVWRVACDATVSVAGLTLRGEVDEQNGRSVTDFPVAGVPATATAPAVPGQSSATTDYLLAGAEYTLGPVTAVYTVSLGSYRDVSVKEWMHVPGISVAVNPNISLLGELVFWQHDTPQGSSLVDRSFNLTLNAHL
jgi:hypothetical protein